MSVQLLYTYVLRGKSDCRYLPSGQCVQAFLRLTDDNVKDPASETSERTGDRHSYGLIPYRYVLYISIVNNNVLHYVCQLYKILVSTVFSI